MSDKDRKPTPDDIPQQGQKPPGDEQAMEPRPSFEQPERVGSRRLEGRRAFVTGADSGIGRSVAVLFAREGADVAVAYLAEDSDAEETRRAVEAEGRRCVLLRGDLGDPKHAREAVARAAEELGGLDIVVSNAAEQHPQPSLDKISDEQMERTFRTNVFAMFYVVRAALPHLERSAEEGRDPSVVCTTSVTTYKGSGGLIDYASTKGAIVGFVRSLSQNLAPRIRVNAVAPGPIWTPLIPSTFPPEEVDSFGKSTPMKRPGQPEEVAPSFVFLASSDASYMTGQTLHPNGGHVVNG